jgi:hypothetical protein
MLPSPPRTTTRPPKTNYTINAASTGISNVTEEILQELVMPKKFYRIPCNHIVSMLSICLLYSCLLIQKYITITQFNVRSSFAKISNNMIVTTVYTGCPKSTEVPRRQKCVELQKNVTETPNVVEGPKKSPLSEYHSQTLSVSTKWPFV